MKIKAIMTTLLLMSMMVTVIHLAKAQIVPDPSYESFPFLPELHSTRGFRVVPYPPTYPSVGICTSDSFTGRISIELSAYQKDNVEIWTRNYNPAIELDAITSVTFWYKILAGSHSPYVVLVFDIAHHADGEYEGNLLVLVSTEVSWEGVVPSDWILYTKTIDDDWHYLVLDRTEKTVIASETGSLSVIQRDFDGKIRVHERAFAVEIGDWIYEETATALVDELSVNVGKPD